MTNPCKTSPASLATLRALLDEIKEWDIDFFIGRYTHEDVKKLVTRILDLLTLIEPLLAEHEAVARRKKLEIDAGLKELGTGGIRETHAALIARTSEITGGDDE